MVFLLGSSGKRKAAKEANERDAKKSRVEYDSESSEQQEEDFDTKEDMLNRPPRKEALDMAASIKERLLAQIELLGNQLPPNTLDQLIDELGGPENVAEMTGRKGRFVQNDNGQVI